MGIVQSAQPARYNYPMPRYSLRTLMIVMLFGGPALAMAWWLRDTWSVQVLAILVLMTVALCAGCQAVLLALAGCDWLISALIATHRQVRSSIRPRD
jgi:hypothetical protein